MKTPRWQAARWSVVLGVLILGLASESFRVGADVPAAASTGSEPSSPPGSATSTNPPVAPIGSNPPPAVKLEVVQEPVLPPELDLSPALQEVVKLVQGGVAEDVIVTYITNSTNIFYVGADEIVYLTDLGLSPEVITLLIQHDAAPAAATRKQAAASTPSSATVPAQAQPPPATPPAQVATTNPPPAQMEDAALAAPSPPKEPVSVTYFQTVLAPYGSWITVPEYGLCWRPTVAVVNRSWRPYAHHGRWLWTDCGWYWYSHYSWGWAPFHYGRWCDYPRIGWVWVPGVVWAPSWVTWRYTRYHCGWAPLPPRCDYIAGFGLHYRNSSVSISFGFGLADDCYTFIPLNRFCDRNPHKYFVARGESKSIYKESTVVNNYITGNNNTIINQGIGYERIAQRTREPIRRVSVRDSAFAATTSPASSRATAPGMSARTLKAEVPRHSHRYRGELFDPETETLTIRRPEATAIAARPAVARPDRPSFEARRSAIAKEDRPTPTVPRSSASIGSSPPSGSRLAETARPNAQPERPGYLAPERSLRETRAVPRSSAVTVSGGPEAPGEGGARPSRPTMPRSSANPPAPSPLPSPTASRPVATDPASRPAVARPRDGAAGVPPWMTQPRPSESAFREVRATAVTRSAETATARSALPARPDYAPPSAARAEIAGGTFRPSPSIATPSFPPASPAGRSMASSAPSVRAQAAPPAPPSGGASPTASRSAPVSSRGESLRGIRESRR